MSRTMKTIACSSCRKEPLSKEEVGICMKLLGEDTATLLCLDCLASYLDCEVEQLLEKIEEFKDEGCVLFQ